MASDPWRVETAADREAEQVERDHAEGLITTAQRDARLADIETCVREAYENDVLDAVERAREFGYDEWEAAERVRDDWGA